MKMYDLLAKKRDGKELSYEELKYFIEGVTNDIIPDYQVSAMLMAMFINGLNPKETYDLTMLMAHSGIFCDLSDIPGIKVDKHSTGGVGDKTTIVISALAAAYGIPVAKMSGRGLGHTGGTIDKLESIEGFNASLSMDKFKEGVKKIGLAISSAGDELCPADKKLYALRDVTATVNSLPLICASVMSKKIAAGGDRILLDVKMGSGAFINNMDDAVKLAKMMVETGERAGKQTVAIITDMDTPLGDAVGNILEVQEAIAILKNRGPDDLYLLCVELAGRMLVLCGMAPENDYKCKIKRVIANGAGYKKFIEMVKNQGGKINEKGQVVFKKGGNVTAVYTADKTGYITHMDTEKIGFASLALGAGRKTKDDLIDYASGIIFSQKTGAFVEEGQSIAVLISDDFSKIEEASIILESAIEYGDNKPASRPQILGIIDKERTDIFWKE